MDTLKKKMIINFVTFGTGLTGGTRIIMESINGLAKRGHKINLISYSSPQDLSWIDLQADVYYVHRSFLEKVFGWLYRKVFGFQPWPEEETRKLMNFMKTLPPCDISVATISYSAFAVSRSGIGIPYHYYMHYEPYVRADGYKKKIIEESYHIPTKKIVNSSWLAETMEIETGEKAVGIAFSAIDHSIFYPRPELKKQKNEKFTIVSLAKDRWWKGLHFALKAVEIVRNRGYDIEYLAFGNTFDKSNLPEDVQHIDFKFTGPKMNNELAEFYAKADLLVSPSLFESFPLPPIEAMACGTPVVTTPFGTEDYAFDRRNALVVEPKNYEQMADAIIELIEDKELYNRLAKEGIITAKKFTWESSVDQLERIFIEGLKESLK